MNINKITISVTSLTTEPIVEDLPEIVDRGQSDHSSSSSSSSPSSSSLLPPTFIPEESTFSSFPVFDGASLSMQDLFIDDEDRKNHAILSDQKVDVSRHLSDDENDSALTSSMHERVSQNNWDHALELVIGSSSIERTIRNSSVEEEDPELAYAIALSMQPPSNEEETSPNLAEEEEDLVLARVLLMSMEAPSNEEKTSLSPAESFARGIQESLNPFCESSDSSSSIFGSVLPKTLEEDPKVLSMRLGKATSQSWSGFYKLF